MNISSDTDRIAALRYSARVAVLDLEITSYVEDDSKNHIWLDNVRFGSVETAVRILDQHGIDAAWIVDEITGSQELTFVSQIS